MGTDLDVVVDTDPCHFPFGVFVVPLLQRAQSQLLHFGEGPGAAPWQLLERLLIQSPSSARSGRLSSLRPKKR